MSTHNRTLETVDESRGPFNSFQIVVCCRYIYVQPHNSKQNDMGLTDTHNEKPVVYA